MATHRKLIRPSIKGLKDSGAAPPEMQQPPLSQTPSQAKGNVPVSRRKQIPAEQTNAESFYYLKQMATKTPMVIILEDGEQIRGVIEWYDRHCLKVNRHKEPNLMIMKQCIRYMYKQEDEVKHHRRGGRKRVGTKEAAEKED